MQQIVSIWQWQLVGQQNDTKLVLLGPPQSLLLSPKKPTGRFQVSESMDKL